VPSFLREVLEIALDDELGGLVEEAVVGRSFESRSNDAGSDEIELGGADEQERHVYAIQVTVTPPRESVEGLRLPGLVFRSGMN
jgi:hypothetical protein